MVNWVRTPTRLSLMLMLPPPPPPPSHESHANALSLSLFLSSSRAGVIVTLLLSFFLALKIRLNFLALFCLSAMFVDSFVSRFLLHLLHRCRFFSSFFLFARGFFFKKTLFSCRCFQNPDAASLTQRRRRSYGPRCQSRPFRLAFSREGKTVLGKRPCAAVACPFMDIIFFPLSSPPAAPGHLWKTKKKGDRPQTPTPPPLRTPPLSP